MGRKRSLAVAGFELAAVLLITAAAFAWGVKTARLERGYEAIGGEYLLLLLPAIYYAGKQAVLDWIGDLRRLCHSPKQSDPCGAKARRAAAHPTGQGAKNNSVHLQYSRVERKMQP